MKFLRDTDSDTLAPYLLTTGLLLIVSAIFVPVAAILFIQDLLFFSYDHLSFIRPQAAYSGFAAGMAIIGVLLFSLLFTKMVAEKKRKKYRLAWPHVILFALALPVFGLAVSHYAYLDEDGAHANPFWSFTEQSVAWEDVESVTRIIEENTSRVLSYTFTTPSEAVTIPYDTQDFQTVRVIQRVRSAYDWPTTDILKDTGKSLQLFDEE